jgi:hypothetical protein
VNGLGYLNRAKTMLKEKEQESLPKLLPYKETV